VTRGTTLPVFEKGSFRGTKLARSGTWVVAFLADWCPFCRDFRTVLEGFPQDSAYSLGIADVTSEESPLWDRFRIEIVPTLVVFRDGATIFRVDGVANEGLDRRDLERAVAASRPGGATSGRGR
jgi:thioredoxin-like negative regulator of GroEL